MFDFLKKILYGGGSSQELSGTTAQPSTLRNPSAWLVSLFGGGDIHVNEESALGLTVVYGCVKVLAETIAALPKNVYIRNGRNREVDSAHRAHYLIHTEPNGYQTPYFFHEYMVMCTVLWGNAYALIKRNEYYEVEALIPYHPKKVTPVLLENGELWYKLADVVAPVPSRDMIHIPYLGFDGVQGKSAIQIHREAISTGLYAQRFGNNFYKNGANIAGTLEHPAKLTPTAADRIRKSFNEKFSGIDNSHSVVVLEEGMKYNRIGIPPEDAQYIETRKFTIEEIAGRIFRVPLHLVGSLEHATFSNIEHQGIEFVQYTLLPLVTRIEQEYNRKLFTEREKREGKYYTKINLNGLLRGDMATRASFYNTLFNLGAISPNEVRDLEDMNPYDGGDDKYIQLNMSSVTNPQNINSNKDE